MNISKFLGLGILALSLQACSVALNDAASDAASGGACGEPVAIDLSTMAKAYEEFDVSLDATGAASFVFSAVDLVITGIDLSSVSGDFSALDVVIGDYASVTLNSDSMAGELADLSSLDLTELTLDVQGLVGEGEIELLVSAYHAESDKEGVIKIHLHLSQGDCSVELHEEDDVDTDLNSGSGSDYGSGTGSDAESGSGASLIDISIDAAGSTSLSESGSTSVILSVANYSNDMGAITFSIVNSGACTMYLELNQTSSINATVSLNSYYYDFGIASGTGCKIEATPTGAGYQAGSIGINYDFQ
jgi:hypothetical protein